MMPVTPAAVALQRAQKGSSAPPAPGAVHAAATGPFPSQPSARAATAHSAPGLRRAPRWLIATAVVGVAATAMLLLTLLGAGGYYAWHLITTRAGALTVESPTPGIRIWLGTREIGAPPFSLAEDDLTGEPLIAVAPGHRPDFVRGERLLELVRGPYPALPIALDPSQVPMLVAYVRYDGQGIAHLPSGEDIGPVPGVIMVPLVGGMPPVVSIWDESGHETDTLSLASCVLDVVCVLRAGSVRE